MIREQDTAISGLRARRERGEQCPRREAQLPKPAPCRRGSPSQAATRSLGGGRPGTAPRLPGSGLARAGPADGRDKAPSKCGPRESSQGTERRPAAAAPRQGAKRPHLGAPVPRPPAGLPRKERPGTAPLKERARPSTVGPSSAALPPTRLPRRFRLCGRACAAARPDGSRTGPNFARQRPAPGWG